MLSPISDFWPRLAGDKDEVLGKGLAIITEEFIKYLCSFPPHCFVPAAGAAHVPCNDDDHSDHGETGH